MRRALFAIALITCLYSLTARAASLPTTKNSCIQCHEFIGGEMGQPVSEWYGSIHQSQGITCDVCHGGNPDVELGHLRSLPPETIRNLAKRTMYSVSDFVGAPTGKPQFDLCANCHPEAVKTYAASIMGRAYLEKKGGPSCTVCHGAHRNVIPNVPQTCKGCHQDTTGFEKLPAMSIGEAQVAQLARIRIQMAGEKVAGKGPLFQRHLESFETGIVSWGLVLVLFLAAVALYRVLERRRR